MTMKTPHHHHDHGHHHHSFADAEALAQSLDNPERDAWQQPNEVLRAMDLMPTMCVADVGAGTGYFAVRLARAVPAGEVIASDLEPNMLQFIAERAARERLPNLRTVLATALNAGLARESVDRILVVHVWHHVADREAFARDLMGALRPGGRLFIVEFAMDAQHGPPESMRLTPEATIASLRAAGVAATISPATIAQQYIVEAIRE